MASGRLIKVCLNNMDIMFHYVKICDAIDIHKKDEILQKLMQQGL